MKHDNKYLQFYSKNLYILEAYWGYQGQYLVKCIAAVHHCVHESIHVHVSEAQ